MKFNVIRGFCLGGGVDVFPGQTVELNETDAALKLRQGKVAVIKAAPAPAPEEKPKAPKGAQDASK